MTNAPQPKGSEVFLLHGADVQHLDDPGNLFSMFGDFYLAFDLENII